MNTPAHTLPPDFAVSEGKPRLWLLRITAHPEPQLLARILSKVAVPTIKLLAVEYRIEDGGDRVRCTLCLSQSAGRSVLVQAKLKQLVAVEEVCGVQL